MPTTISEDGRIQMPSPGTGRGFFYCAKNGSDLARIVENHDFDLDRAWKAYQKTFGINLLFEDFVEAYKLTSEYAENKDKVKLEEKVLAEYSGASNIEVYGAEVYGADAPFWMPRGGSVFWDYIKHHHYDVEAAIAAYQEYFKGWKLPKESLVAALKLTDEYKIHRDELKNMPGEKKEEKKEYRLAEGGDRIIHVREISSKRDVANGHFADAKGNLDYVAEQYYFCLSDKQKCSLPWFRALWYREIVKAGWLKGLEEGKDYTVSEDMKFGPELDKSFGPYLIWNTEDGRKIPVDQLDFIHGHNICKKFEKEIDAAWEYTAKASPVGTFTGFRDASLYAIERKTRRILAGLEAVQSEQKAEDNAGAKDARFPGKTGPGDSKEDPKDTRPEVPPKQDWQVKQPDYWPYDFAPDKVVPPAGFRLGPFRKATRDEYFIPTGQPHMAVMQCVKEQWSSARIILYPE